MGENRKSEAGKDRRNLRVGERREEGTREQGGRQQEKEWSLGMEGCYSAHWGPYLLSYLLPFSLPSLLLAP